MATTVHVENISKQTSEKEVRDFFSFCGKISSLSVTPTEGDYQSATVSFEKETAAKTALLLDNTQLGTSQVHVKGGKSLGELAGGNTTDKSVEDEEFSQEDKPRSRILAEYLAHGYTVSDKAIQRAIDLDQQHGISTRFTSTLRNLDQRFKATEKAQAVDTKYNISGRAAAGWQGVNSYFDKAISTPSGQKIRNFYLMSNQQVADVHNEARHLANLKSGKSSEGSGVEKVPGTERTKCDCGADSGKCPCTPGQCACASCGKNPEAAKSESKAGAEEAQNEKGEGTHSTK